MSLKAHLEELEGINNELKSLTQRRKKLNIRKKIVEDFIKDFLISKEQLGVKHHGLAYKLNENDKRQPKKKYEQEQHSLEVLRKYGVDNPEIVLKEVVAARKGYLIPSDKLKIEKIKNNDNV